MEESEDLLWETQVWTSSSDTRRKNRQWEEATTRHQLLWARFRNVELQLAIMDKEVKEPRDQMWSLK